MEGRRRERERAGWCGEIGSEEDIQRGKEGSKEGEGKTKNVTEDIKKGRQGKNSNERIVRKGDGKKYRVRNEESK